MRLRRGAKRRALLRISRRNERSSEYAVVMNQPLLYDSLRSSLTPFATTVLTHLSFVALQGGKVKLAECYNMLGSFCMEDAAQKDFPENRKELERAGIWFGRSMKKWAEVEGGERSRVMAGCNLARSR